MIGLRLRFS